MRKVLLLFTLILSVHFSIGQIQIVRIDYPQLNTLWDNLVSVDVYIYPYGSAASVTAEVGGTTITLSREPTFGYHYTGSISLVGLAEDTFDLHVVATDVNNQQTSVSRAFIRDLSPHLIIDSPLNWSVANPTFRVKATCADQDGCWIRLFGTPDLGVYNFGNSVDTVINLSGIAGYSQRLTWEAIDGKGMSTWVSQLLYVENSSHLKPFFAGNDEVLDFKNYHVLLNRTYWTGSNHIEDNPFATTLSIHHIVTNDSVFIPVEMGFNGGIDPGTTNPTAYRSYLTPYGALFNVRNTACCWPQVAYEWNNGKLDTLGMMGGTLKVAGNFGIWSDPQNLYLRDLAKRQQMVISSNALNAGTELDSNGMVVFSALDAPAVNIYRRSNNNTIAITHETGTKWNMFPLFDGDEIVYSRTDSGQLQDSNSVVEIHLYKGQRDTLLSTLRADHYNNNYEGGLYQIKNGYLAYLREDVAGGTQIWLRDFDGIYSEVSQRSERIYLENINTNGDLMYLAFPAYSSYGKRFFANRLTKTVTEISSVSGRSFFDDGYWWLTMGRMLFQLDIPRITGPIVPTLQRPILSELDSTYCVDKTSLRITIFNLPDTTNGFNVLAKLDGNRVPISAGNNIVVDISSLSLGKHNVSVTFMNAAGLKTSEDSFYVVPMVTPAVRLISSTTRMTNPATPVEFKAHNVYGGGFHPLYTFGADRNMNQILRSEDADSTFSMNSAAFVMGANWVYVRMRTSEDCHTSESGFDSLKIERIAVSGIIDPDFPNQVISVFPNPFVDRINIYGLNAGKNYQFKVYDGFGKEVLQSESSNTTATSLLINTLQSGIHYLKIYDRKKGRLLGTMTVMKN